MMGRLGNVVVLNGKSYSVDTGELVRPGSKSVQESAQATKTQVEAIKRLTQPAPTRHKPTAVNKHPHHTDLSTAARAKKIEVKSAAINTKAADPLSHKFHESSTNMRPKSLKRHKPAATVHSKASTTKSSARVPAPHSPRISHVSHVSKPKSQVATRAPRIDLGISQSEGRRFRAAQHRRNEQISKFAAARRKHSTKSDNNLAPAQATASEPVPKINIKPSHMPVNARIAAAKVPVSAAVAAHHPRQKTISELVPTMRQPVTEAIKPAPQIKKDTHGRAERFGLTGFAPAAAISITVIALIAYMSYLNVPNLAMRVAASRAGFDASMPAYTPNGFSFDGPIAYNSGQIVVDFTSNTDDRTYTLAQRKSNWNSQSLLENAVKPKTDNYLTFEDRGLTIYVYNGSSATWVNGGVWYTIKGDGSKLNTEQLVKIATSL